MRKYILVSTILAISLGLAGCADKPNPDLENARANFIELQNNPKASRMAAAETVDASSSLDKADKAYRDGLKASEVTHLSYLLQRRVDLANATIALREAEEAQRQKKTELDIGKKTERGSVVTFGDVLFALNKADLNPTAYENLDKLAVFLIDNKERQVLVEGFTDSTGSETYNLTLSQRRADAVARALSNRGVEFSRVQAKGFGKAFPVASNSNASDRALNRRVEVTVSNDDKPVAARR